MRFHRRRLETLYLQEEIDRWRRWHSTFHLEFYILKNQWKKKLYNIFRYLFPLKFKRDNIKVFLLYLLMINKLKKTKRFYITIISSLSISTLIYIVSSRIYSNEANVSKSVNFCAPKLALRSVIGRPKNGLFSLQIFGLTL